jgi:hypothetical protein
MDIISVAISRYGGYYKHLLNILSNMLDESTGLPTVNVATDVRWTLSIVYVLSLLLD